MLLECISKAPEVYKDRQDGEGGGVYVSYLVVPRVEVVSSGVFRPSVLVIAYDDEVPLNELVCDGANPVTAYDDAMVAAEILALRIRSRVEKSIQQIDIRLPAIQAMLQRMGSTGSHEHVEPVRPLDLAATQSAKHMSRMSSPPSQVRTGTEVMEGSLVHGKAFTLRWAWRSPDPRHRETSK